MQSSLEASERKAAVASALQYGLTCYAFLQGDQDGRFLWLTLHRLFCLLPDAFVLPEKKQPSPEDRNTEYDNTDGYTDVRKQLVIAQQS